MNEFVVPHQNKFGKGCLKDLGDLAKGKNLLKAIIVTDKNLVNLGFDRKIAEILDLRGIESVTYGSVEPNPTKKNVYDALELYKHEKCDFIIGLGGGSANDCSKALSILANNEGKLENYVGFNKSQNPSPILITVNTTAGTASEISRAFLISDHDKQEKLIFKDIHALPYCSYNDPELMMGLPASITAATGMDALTHALEAYVSTGSYGLTREFALSAIRLVFDNLENVVKDLSNLQLRENMIYAQSLAGMAFCNSGVGLAHAMAHQLGGVYNLPHGLSNAILLPYVMEYNRQVCEAEYADIARIICNETQKNQNAEVLCTSLIEKVRMLSECIGTSISLGSLGVKEEDLGLLAEKALMDGNMPRNPIQPSKDDIIKIFKKAL